MDRIRWMILFIICIVDAYLFNMYFESSSLQDGLTYGLIHIALWMVERHIYKGEKETRREDFGFLSLFVPIFGFFVRALGEFIDKNVKTQNEIVRDDYEKYILFKRDVSKKENLDLEEEINTMSILDELKFASNSSKKKSIIELIFYDIDEKVFLLKKGLLDDDSEVSHYCAATLNMIEQEFEDAIHELRDKYSIKRESRYMKSLLDIYKRYLASGIIEGEFRLVVAREYKEILLEYIQGEESEVERSLDLLDVEMDLGHYENAKKIINRICEDEKHKTAGNLRLMKLLFLKGDYAGIGSVARKLLRDGAELEQDQMDIIRYWAG